MGCTAEETEVDVFCGDVGVDYTCYANLQVHNYQLYHFSSPLQWSIWLTYSRQSNPIRHFLHHSTRTPQSRRGNRRSSVAVNNHSNDNVETCICYLEKVECFWKIAWVAEFRDEGEESDMAAVGEDDIAY